MHALSRFPISKNAAPFSVTYLQFRAHPLWNVSLTLDFLSRSENKRQGIIMRICRLGLFSRHFSNKARLQQLENELPLWTEFD
jgi:hypothetical protein